MDTNNETLSRYYAKKKKRKKQRKYVFYTLLTIFFVTVITVLSLTVFFNINDIAVTGNEYYTDAQIIEASGLEKGQNLFKLNKFKIIESVKKQMPYLAEVEIDRHLPVGIEIIVKESAAYMYVESAGEFYILDETLKLLEITDTEPELLPSVKGISLQSAVVGQQITTENGEDARLRTLTTAAKEYINNNWFYEDIGSEQTEKQPCITDIDVTTSYEVKFTYMDRVSVELGTVENVENKLRLVQYVVEENRSTEDAVIDVSDGKYAYYRSVDRSKQDVEIDTSKDSEKESEKESENE